MEETKWLTKGKIILMVILLFIIGIVVTIIMVNRSNLRKDYIKFQEQLEYAAPNYLLKEKIELMENEWREIKVKEIMAQKLVINKRASDCTGYVIAEAHENVKQDKEEDEATDTDLESENELKTDMTDTQTESQVPKTETKETDKKVSNNITYKAYITCKKIYKTEGYGTKPKDKQENDEKTQTQKDTEKPVIELFGDEKIELTEGEEYKELGAAATDNIDGDITSKIKITGKVDTKKAGEYIIKYTVSDSSKNKSTKKRVVIVKPKKEEEKVEPAKEEPSNPEPEKPSVPSNETPSKPAPVADTTSPVIIFNDDSLYQTICTGNSVNISTNGAYGYIARDNVDGNITSRVKITGDTGIMQNPGIYNLYYEVSDNSGNKAYAKKQFTVKNCSSTIPSTTVKTPVSSIEITPKIVKLSVSETKELNITIYPSNADDKTLIFESLNSKIATVSQNGIITAVASGSTRIKISSSNGKVAWCEVEVN